VIFIFRYIAYLYPNITQLRMKSLLNLFPPAAVAAFRRISYPKGQILLHTGDISDKIWLIEEGMVREFFVPEGRRELTTQIAGAGSFIYSPSSYLSGEPSGRIIEAIEKCRVIPVARDNTTPHFLQAVFEQTIVRTEKHNAILQLKHPLQRLEAFERLYPELCNRIPLYYVASLLNMTPQTLSRVRSSRARPPAP